LEGVCLVGLLREKKIRIWVPFLGTRRHEKLSLGAIWNFSKEQGYPEQISNYGKKWVRL
jgi:hypothetical protein